MKESEFIEELIGSKTSWIKTDFLAEMFKKDKIFNDYELLYFDSLARNRVKNYDKLYKDF